MFAQNPFNFTNVNSLLSSQNRVFDAQGDRNTISAVMSQGGAYAGKQRYFVNYARPTGTLKSKGHDTLHQALADSNSGKNSVVRATHFISYWKKDEWLATWNGAPKGLAKDGVQPQPAPAPAPTPAPTPIDIEIDTINVEDDTDTETGDPSDDPSITTDDGTTDSTESGEDISTLSDTTELVETEKEVRPAFILLPIIALAGIGYFTYTESKKK